MILFTEVRNSKGKVFFRLLFDEQKQIFKTLWQGYLQLDDIKRGTGKVINFLRQNEGKYFGHINDVSGMKRLWSAKKDKFGGIFVPKLNELGVSFQAEIKTHEQMKESADNHYPLINIGDAKYNIFRNDEDAITWLIGQNHLHLS